MQSSLYKGDVNIITGVHGASDGSTVNDLRMYFEDVKRFGDISGVRVYDFSGLSEPELRQLLNGSDTTIGAFCNSGPCLQKYR